MVFLCKNVYRRSLSSGPDPTNSRLRESLSNRDPQGLRRPRFSFFFLTCQTARREAPTPEGANLARIKQSAKLKSSSDGKSASDLRRLPGFTHRGEDLAGPVLAGGRGPRRRRAQWPVYRPRLSDLSTHTSQKLHRRDSGIKLPRHQAKTR